MGDSDLLFCIKIREEIAGMSQWKVGELWQQSDFLILADKIEKVTGSQVSVSTLKRLWKKEDYVPRMGTLNILAEFAGYTDWSDFIEKKKECEVIAVGKRLQKRKRDLTPAILWKRVIMISLFFLICFFLGWFFFRDFHSDKVEDYELSTETTTKSGVPTTIVFNYKVPTDRSDKYYIQLSWNPLERTEVLAANSYLASTYYFPGLHRSKLVVNDQIVKTQNIYITSPDWVTLYRYSPTDVVPSYINLEDVRHDGMLTVEKSLLEQYGADTRDDIYVSYIYSNDMAEIDIDNMQLETRLRSLPINNATVCGESWLYLYGDNGDVAVPLANKGCEGNLFVKLGETFIDGKVHLLSEMGCDLSDFQVLGLRFFDKHLECLINDSIKRKFQYEEELGTLRAIQFFFHGSGAVDYLYLKGLDSEKRFSVDF